MKNTKKILAAFLMLTLLIVPARVYAASPEIDISGIELFRSSDFETGEPVSAVSIPFGDAQALYWLLLDSEDAPPADSAELITNSAAVKELPDAVYAPRLYLEWPSLEINTDYTLYLAAENEEGLSGLVPYQFTHLPFPPEVEITSQVELQSATSARVSYTVIGNAQAVYWLLVPDADSYNPIDADMRNANHADASSGAHTLELSGFDPNTAYTLWMMAENATGSTFGFISFNTALLPPDINNVSVFGVSASAATVQVMVDFLALPDGKVYMLVVKDAVGDWPNDSTELKQRALGNGVLFPMNSGVETQQLSGLMPETEYSVYITAESTAGLSPAYLYAEFTTLADNAEEAPVVTASPAHQTVSGTGDVSFTVNASGEDLHYQWQSIASTYGGADWIGGSELAWENLLDDEIINGAITERLVILESAFANGDYYNIAFRCVVTNGAGSVVSDLAVLAVEGRYPILKSVGGVLVDEHHPIGWGLNMDNRFEAKVTVPHTTTELDASDLIVDYSDGHTWELYSGDDYATVIPSQTLDEGPNDVYFTIADVEASIYYHVTVTREVGNPGGGSDPDDGSDPGGGSGTPGSSGSGTTFPKVGDRLPLIPLVVIAVLSAAGLGVALLRGRAKRKR